MEARATEAGLATILCNTRAAAFREADYVHMLLDRRVDGMIFIACEMTHLGGEHEHYARLLDEGARLVFVNGALEGSTSRASRSTSGTPASWPRGT